MLGAGARALIERGLSAAGRSVSTERLEEMYLAFLARYEAHIADESRVFPGVEAALDRFQRRVGRSPSAPTRSSIPLCVCSTELGLAAAVPGICGQNTFAFCKPDPRALISTIARAGGDSHARSWSAIPRPTSSTAQAAAIPVIAVDFGYTDRHVSEFDAGSRHLAFRRVLGSRAVAGGGGGVNAS